jgi:hypothetical protein
MAHDGRIRPVGSVSGAAFAGYAAGTLIGLWAVGQAWGSSLLQWLALMASVEVWGALAKSAAITRPLPPTPQPPPGTRWWLLLLVLLADLALLVGLGLASKELLGFEPGPWFWFFLCFVVPLLATINWFGTQTRLETTPRKQAAPDGT